MTEVGAGPSRCRAARLPVLLFFALFAVYLANGTETDEGDALPSIKLPFALLSYHRLSFEPELFPDLFDYVWRRKFGAMDVDDAKRLKVLETENARGQVLQRRYPFGHARS